MPPVITHILAHTSNVDTATMRHAAIATRRTLQVQRDRDALQRAALAVVRCAHAAAIARAAVLAQAVEIAPVLPVTTLWDRFKARVQNLWTELRIRLHF